MRVLEGKEAGNIAIQWWLIAMKSNKMQQQRGLHAATVIFAACRTAAKDAIVTIVAVIIPPMRAVMSLLNFFSKLHDKLHAAKFELHQFKEQKRIAANNHQRADEVCCKQSSKSR